MITPTDIGGDEDRARRVIVHARSIAPCIDSFPDGSEDKKNAVAILKGVLAELPTAGRARVKGQRVGPASVEYFDVASAFSADDRAALRALCGAASRGGLPLGSFPQERPVARLWPESYA